MGKKPYLFAIVLLLFVQITAFGGGSSNKKEPFTKKILNGFSFAELNQAYYYVDSTLILTRVVPHGETRSVVKEGEDEGGTITVINGETVETIRIPDNVLGKLLSSDKGVLGVCFSTNKDRILYFTEEFIGTEFFLRASGSTVKYGQYDYKVNKKPKLLVQYFGDFNRDKKPPETETGGW